jgi:hypothetical protein
VAARDRGQPGEPREAGCRVVTGPHRRLVIPHRFIPPIHTSSRARALVAIYDDGIPASEQNRWELFGVRDAVKLALAYVDIG